MNERERLWLLQSGWQPVSNGWVMPVACWGVELLSQNHGGKVCSDQEALFWQNALCDNGLIPPFAATECEQQSGKPAARRARPKRAKPSSGKKNRWELQRETEEKNRLLRREHWIKVTGLPPPEEREPCGAVVEGDDKHDQPCFYPSQPYGRYILAMRDDARQVSYKAILEDSSPWGDVALRIWEDGEMD